jgi:hypothetical protein
MKTKTGILALGLLTLAGVVVVSCGGSSDTGDTGTSTAGTTSTTGGNGTAGSSTSGGTNSSSGTGTSAGTSNTSGNTNGGNTTAGTNTNGGNTNGGTTNNTAGAQDAAGAPAAVGGAAATGCPATQPADGTACTQAEAGFQGCNYSNDTVNCRCRRVNGGQMRQWQCMDVAGAAGAGSGGTTCPDNANTGDTCTNGPGLCAGQQCFCGANNMVTCF